MQRGDEPADRAGTSLDELSREECWELLATSVVGRLAVITAEGLPFVVPVNYALDGETVIFRTEYGMKYDALLRHPVAFQVDSIDPNERTGWTVLLQGVAHETTPRRRSTSPSSPGLGPGSGWCASCAATCPGDE